MSLRADMLRHIADLADNYAREHGTTATVAEFAAHLRTTAAQAEEKCTREGDATPLPAASFDRARRLARVGGFFRLARIGRAETGGDQ
ncbi:hypothetical protein [Streptomyces misionensis]|uniref:hypothetical protein n=1 Tax=Streptomyces misionensis TaxID=67331 RepID=UPI003675D1D3